MKTTLIAAVLTTVALSALADGTAAPQHRNADHPAVAVQRLWAAQGYDYAAQFYPHPAWLYLAAEAPRPMSDHPAVIVARRERERLAEQATTLQATAARR